MIRKHPWHKIDPQLLSGEVSMKSISVKFGIPYRQVTNRKYAIRNRYIATANAAAKARKTSVPKSKKL